MKKLEILALRRIRTLAVEIKEPIYGFPHDHPGTAAEMTTPVGMICDKVGEIDYWVQAILEDSGN